MTSPDRHQKRRQRTTAARFYAVQALFQMEASGQSADRVRMEFEQWRIGAEDEALARLAERLANGDITPEEYLERSSVLRGSQPGPNGTAGSAGKE